MVKFESFQACIEFSFLPGEDFAESGRLCESWRGDYLNRCEELACFKCGLIK